MVGEADSPDVILCASTLQLLDEVAGLMLCVELLLFVRFSLPFMDGLQ
jgi:hypothetical protein